ncbi:DUF3899 domain-containing protein [Aureibacillus halotolerans]|uniref:Uncharacterized protein DUF3899 n=1 Tax=Aureibacillus halotolerans TaxID=1508390 RepID=A0A4R6UCQ2_9BACI|nr:DUF3899 domain-containing protein [Aureibacillus halotolerans]TDQ42819.1 uncharacterized protein DUF3899 [Aureibacillus halotolerans]
MPKKYLYTYIAGVLLTALFVVWYQEVTLRTIADSLFTISLLFLCVGLFSKIFGAGFFNGFISGLKKLRRLESGEQSSNTPSEQHTKTHPARLFLVVGGTFLVLSLVLAYL